LLLSTSTFVTNYSFSELFNYKEIINAGYPRNDALRYDDIELVNVNLILLNEMKNSNTKYVVYMPTHRIYGFSDNPIDYKELNEFGKIHNIKFIIKMHPLVAEKVREDLLSYQKNNYEFTNLIIYPAYMDIYPILKYSDILLADYSSVYFDYLFLDKPIVFFPYDFEKWAKSEKGTRIDYFKYSPGDKAYTFEELKDMILKNLKIDEYKKQRDKLLNLMFENINEKSSKLITDKLIKYMETDSG
jgi:CDP-glycerol glycerophosphotransferase (TagB/SpsB family)